MIRIINGKFDFDVFMINKNKKNKNNINTGDNKNWKFQTLFDIFLVFKFWSFSFLYTSKETKFTNTFDFVENFTSYHKIKIYT